MPTIRQPLIFVINSRIRIGILVSVIIQGLLSSAALVFWQNHSLKIQFNEIGVSSAAQISSALNFGNELLVVGELNRITMSGPIFAARVFGPDVNYVAVRQPYRNQQDNVFDKIFEAKTSLLLNRYTSRRFVLATAQSVKGEYVFSIVADRLDYLPPLLGILALLIFLAGLNYLILTKYIRATANKVSSPFSKLANYLSTSGLKEKMTFTVDEAEVHEFFVLLNALKNAQHEMVDFQQKVNRLELAARLGTLAQQVAHDIRSPLSALDMALKDTTSLPEETRILVRSAAQRIRDIANNLLKKDQSAQSSDTHSAIALTQIAQPTDASATHLLSSLIDSIVSEKRMQYRAMSNIDIHFEPTEKGYGMFARVGANEFKRVVSNLINNCVESIGEGGRVKVELVEGENRFIAVRIVDNGKGIPPEVLANLGRLGVSVGKDGSESGSGLGLYHARRAMQSWGGDFRIDSTVNVGTTVTLSLPRATPPSWFVERLQLPPAGTVVVVDDDLSIHKVWDGRFSSSAPSVKLVHFSSPDEFEQWADTNTADLYLMDMELIGFKSTGLDLIERLHLSKKAFMVTSRYEEPQVQARCSRLNVGLIPKALATLVPITTSALAGTPSFPDIDAVLIDDDLLVHMTWKSVANSKGKSLLCFTTVDGFFAHPEKLKPSTPVYIDSNLSDGKKGEIESEKIAQAGFINIRLATGSEPGSFVSKPWIKEIVGKVPPWV